MEAALVFPDEEEELDRSAGGEAEIPGEPRPWMQDVFPFGVLGSVRQEGFRQPAHERIGRFAIARADAGGQIGQHRGGFGFQEVGRRQRPLDDAVVEHQAPALQDGPSRRAVAQGESTVIERADPGEDGRQRGSRPFRIRAAAFRTPNEERVRPGRSGGGSPAFAGRIQNPAQVVERQEDRPGGPLSGEQGEIAGRHSRR